jgi:hypothetical protein
MRSQSDSTSISTRRRRDTGRCQRWRNGHSDSSLDVNVPLSASILQTSPFMAARRRVFDGRLQRLREPRDGSHVRASMYVTTACGSSTTDSRRLTRRRPSAPSTATRSPMPAINAPPRRDGHRVAARCLSRVRQSVRPCRVTVGNCDTRSTASTAPRRDILGPRLRLTSARVSHFERRRQRCPRPTPEKGQTHHTARALHRFVATPPFMRINLIRMANLSSSFAKLIAIKILQGKIHLRSVKGVKNWQQRSSL